MKKTTQLSVKKLSKVFKTPDGDLTALKDISFELYKGEILGVIGNNGAGKSTLLKVLSQITSPTEGIITYDGVLTSILEIGTGFHPDLSGKDNVFLNASLLGYPKKEISKLYEEVVLFSGLKNFMEKPVKHYSSGMYLRLAFSIAFHVKVDILLLDEVMAVGDANFKRKCYEKIQELKTAGTSIIYVSHHLESIVKFCDRCMLLENGHIESIGESLETIQYYNEKELLSEVDNIGEMKTPYVKSKESIIYTYNFDTFVNEQIAITKFHILVNNKEVNFPIYRHHQIDLVLYIEKKTSVGSLEVNWTLHNMNDQCIFIDSHALREDYKNKDFEKGHYKISCAIPKHLLNWGMYILGLGVYTHVEPLKIAEIPGVARFRITDTPNNELDKIITTMIRPHLDWKIEKIGGKEDA